MERQSPKPQGGLGEGCCKTSSLGCLLMYSREGLGNPLQVRRPQT